MIITKKDKMYDIKENKLSWTVSRTAGRLKVTINVPKDVCVSFDELKAYIDASDLF